jgi:hypothetical protein
LRCTTIRSYLHLRRHAQATMTAWREFVSFQSAVFFALHATPQSASDDDEREKTTLKSRTTHSSEE